MQSVVHSSGIRIALLLALLAPIACKGEGITGNPEELFGNLHVQAQSFGVNLDGDGFTLNIRGAEDHSLPAAGERTLNLLAGPALLTINDIADNCHLWGPSSRTVTIAPNSTVQESFTVTCGGGAQHTAFASTRNGNADIFVREEGTGHVTQLTTSAWQDTDPVWSPTGDRIAFASRSTDSVTSYLRIITASGDSVATIGTLGTAAGYPAWSPSQDRIAFTWTTDGQVDLYLVNADGSGLIRLTNTPEDEFRPAWSPDGTQLVYDRDVADTTVVRDLFLINADGSGARQFPTGGKYNFHASWSPDGKQIAFTSQRDGNEELYLADVAGGSVTRLTQNGGADGDPAWAADGHTIVFTSQRSGVKNLYRLFLPSLEVAPLATSQFHEFDAAISR